MSQLRQALRPASSLLLPMVVVIFVIILQGALLAAFFLLAERKQHHIEQTEVMLLLAYSAIAIGGAVLFGVLRHRWMKSENHVRQRLLDVIDAIPDPSAVRDAKGRYIMWNKAAEVYHGIKAEHVVGKTPFELFPKHVARSILEIDSECARTGSVVVQRLALLPLYGKGQRVATIRVAPVRSITVGDVRGVVAILHDITESEREAAALKHMSTQLKLALDTSGFGSWIWDLDSELVTYSAQYQALLRYKGKEFRRDFDFHARIHPGDSAIVVAAAKRSMRENISFDQIYRLRCFDEVYRYFHASGEPALDDTGRSYFAGLLCPLDRSAS
jgi:PAS domain S-box-containing protein